MKLNTKNRVKGGMLALLLAAGVAKGLAEEREGTIVMRKDYSDETAIQVAPKGSRIPHPDWQMSFSYESLVAKRKSFLDTLLKEGIYIVFDDEYYKIEKLLNNAKRLIPEGVISIDGILVADMPEATREKFPASFEAKARGAQPQVQSDAERIRELEAELKRLRS
jgi:hypothetical protein